jgi:ATP-dependent protease Clp ATPase subunit
MTESERGACSFCEKSMKEVRKLIAMNASDGALVYTCDGCVGLMVEILEEDLGRTGTARRRRSRAPDG